MPEFIVGGDPPGDAVAVGQDLAHHPREVGDVAGPMDAAQVQRLARLLERTGLPTAATEVAGSVALDNMRIDKKVKAGKMRFVLLKSIGQAFVTGDYPEQALDATLQAHFA